jgi:predicted  nucleic acid-binding Zn-ribbon protein
MFSIGRLAMAMERMVTILEDIAPMQAHTKAMEDQLVEVQKMVNRERDDFRRNYEKLEADRDAWRQECLQLREKIAQMKERPWDDRT